MPARRTQVPTARAGLLVAAAVIVLGILGMHALHTGGTSSASMTGMSMSSTLNTPGAHQLDERQGPATHRPSAAHRDHPGHDMGDMMMLCAAMLATASIALLALLVLRTAPRTAWLRARTRLTTATVRRTVPVGTGAGPPSAWAFSVIRC